jgi:hypothetical protein
LLLSFVDPSLVRKHLGAQAVNAAEMVGLLEQRAIPAGTPVFLDDVTMLPIEPLCSWFRHLAYDDKDAKTMREYAYIVRRFVHFLQSRGRDLLDATESDLTAYRVMRTDLQDKPVGDAAWAKEAQLINQLAMPIRTGNSSARCAVIAASTADLGEANAAHTPSPVCLNNQPPCASIALRNTSSWAASAARIPSASASHRRVDPSTSVNKNVTTPEGAVAADTPAESHNRPASTSHIGRSATGH